VQRSVQQQAARGDGAFRETFLDRSPDGVPFQPEQGGEVTVGWMRAGAVGCACVCISCPARLACLALEQPDLAAKQSIPGSEE